MGNEYRNKKRDDELTLVEDDKPGRRELILKLIQSDQFCETGFQDSLLKRSLLLGVSIPKQLVSIDEKYMKQCFQLIHATRTNPLHEVSHLNSDRCNTVFVPRHMLLGPNIASDCPKASCSDGLATVGPIMGYQSDSAQKNPVTDSGLGFRNRCYQSYCLQRNQVTDSGSGLPLRKNLVPDLGSCLGSGSPVQKNPVPDSASGLGLGSSSPVQEKPVPDSGSCLGLGSPVQKNLVPDSGSCLGLPVQKNLVPDSGSGSGSCLGSGSSSESSSSQGMLQCTWEDGIPSFVFQLDDQKEVYVANLSKAEVIHEKGIDDIYSFYLKANNDHNFVDLSGIDCDLIGKMKVSTTTSTIPSGFSKVIETEFVLVGTSDNNHPIEAHHKPSRNTRLSRKLSKVTDMFKNRDPSKFNGSRAIPEDTPRNDYFTPNGELAAVVVKEHRKEEIGGWGLKFLYNKSRVEPAVLDSSTSVDVIVPTGPHGGPRTRDGGPSSLIERWRSGGRCDCGGWDIGCPLRVFKTRPNYSESQGNCKSFDMFPEGKEQAQAMLKTVNIRDGLYFISFKSSIMSALQCFAVVVATIHSKTPRLSPKHVQS